MARAKGFMDLFTEVVDERTNDLVRRALEDITYVPKDADVLFQIIPHAQENTQALCDHALDQMSHLISGYKLFNFLKSVSAAERRSAERLLRRIPASRHDQDYLLTTCQESYDRDVKRVSQDILWSLSTAEINYDVILERLVRSAPLAQRLLFWHFTDDYTARYGQIRMRISEMDPPEGRLMTPKVIMTTPICGLSQKLLMGYQRKLWNENDRPMERFISRRLLMRFTPRELNQRELMESIGSKSETDDTEYRMACDLFDTFGPADLDKELLAQQAAHAEYVTTMRFAKYMLDKHFPRDESTAEARINNILEDHFSA